MVGVDKLGRHYQKEKEIKLHDNYLFSLLLKQTITIHNILLFGSFSWLELRWLTSSFSTSSNRWSATIAAVLASRTTLWLLCFVLFGISYKLSPTPIVYLFSSSFKLIYSITKNSGVNSIIETPKCILFKSLMYCTCLFKFFMFGNDYLIKHNGKTKTHPKY